MPGHLATRPKTWLTVAALLLSSATMAAAETETGSCQAHHRLVLTEARIVHEPGDVVGLAPALAARLAKRLETGGHQVIEIVAPTRSEGLTPAMGAFARHNAPYFLRLQASNLGTTGRPSPFVLLPDHYQPRAGQLSVTLDDGARGARLGIWRVDLDEANGKPFMPEVDARSAGFWRSDWGESVDDGINDLADAILATIRCRPLVGRVLSTQRRGSTTDLHVNLGREDGLGSGDRLTVVDPGMPTDWLGVNLLTRPALETTAGPVREPRSLGEARVTYLGERDSTLRYTGRHSVESGDLVQVKPSRDRLERLPN